MAERKSFLLRINPQLWEDLERWAAQELRSVNGQIEFLLRRAVEEKFGRARRSERGQRPPGKTRSRPEGTR